MKKNMSKGHDLYGSQCQRCIMTRSKVYIGERKNYIVELFTSLNSSKYVFVIHKLKIVSDTTILPTSTSIYNFLYSSNHNTNGDIDLCKNTIVYYSLS